MSEKIYACLLRLFPSAFRRQYQEEALRLLRDRLRDEKGFLCRLRLVLDLVSDIVGALPQAHRNSYANVAAAVPLTPRPDGAPTFLTLQEEPIRREVIIVASGLAVTVMATFIFVLGRSIPYRHTAPGGRMSPIESVIERLNHPISPNQADSAYGVRSSGTGSEQPVTNKPPQQSSSRGDSNRSLPSVAVPSSAVSSNAPALTSSALAVNLSGRWASSFHEADTIVELPQWFALKQDSVRLTGTAGSDSSEQHSIIHGSVSGGAVSFEVQNKNSSLRYDLTFQDNALQGTLSIRGKSGTSSTAVLLRRVR